MHPRKNKIRKSLKLESSITNWLEDINEIEDIFKRKSELVIKYANKITNLNNSSKDEKIFLMNGMEDAKYVIENDTFNKLDYILEEILGNEIEENEEIKKMLDLLKQFRTNLDELYISLKNFLKTYNLANAQEIISNFVEDVREKTNAYENIMNKINESFPKVIKYLDNQQKMSRDFDII
ncbi:MAG: hypothetical protein GF329_09575 [Candidatus Lokiarchaeota archaeon]|nr:hypothetical protein [Candidatus Lokiarchaeota archaeon]